jgi:hypothetical protein
MDDTTAAEYVRGRVEAGTDPVMNDLEQYRNVVRRAIESSGLEVGDNPRAFLGSVDTIRQRDGVSQGLNDIVHEALFGDLQQS